MSWTFSSPELLRTAGIALICTVCLLILGRAPSGIGFAVRAGGSLLIFGILTAQLGDTLGAFLDMLSDTDSDGYATQAFTLMLKALGVALISKLCADVCRDCGENGLASGIDGVGRVTVISLCLPVIADILKFAVDFLSLGG